MRIPSINLPPQRPRRVGFTLVELSVSLAVTSILMVAIGSSIVLASHAVPDSRETTSSTITTSKAIDRLVEEVRYAVAIQENTATTLEFAVADRDNDLAYEWIRYAWSGVAGDPLTRQYNGGLLVNVVEQVWGFALSYDTISYKKQAVDVISDEALLAGHTDAAAGGTDTVQELVWTGQFFRPSGLPLDTKAWAITRVQFQARSRGNNAGIAAIQLREATVADLPGVRIHEEIAKNESELQKSFLWEEIVFANVNNLDPAAGMCLVFKWANDAQAMEVQYGSAPGSGRLITTDAGATWTNDSTTALNYAVYGTYATPGAIIDAYALRQVNIQLISGEKSQYAIYASSETLNQPAVASP